ncbi:uncharacterized protein PV07_03722 [Cladophialophora immunda]|uniref:Uncharacterized protein n=1 Tax=Cladophialophora immunda TaxID=569365 RepID=A0A0D2B3F9_9EURO|nr:uncharacterized protein PV07_03722 [Cladophialophora immunda]KIW32152.1 hypothetical protein PV07_03722 [Cladophialophora immunda]
MSQSSPDSLLYTDTPHQGALDIQPCACPRPRFLPDTLLRLKLCLAISDLCKATRGVSGFILPAVQKGATYIYTDVQMNPLSALLLSVLSTLSLFWSATTPISASASNPDPDCASAPSSRASPTSSGLSSSSPSGSSSASISESDATTLYITALTNHRDPPYLARAQCWALAAPFTVYPTVGRALALGAVDNATYVVLPPRSAEGWHRPPHAMFFVLLSGLAQVYVPRRDGESATMLSHGYDDDGDGYGYGEGDDINYAVNPASSSSSPSSHPGQARLQQHRHQLPLHEPHPQPRPDDPRWDTITITPGSPNQLLVAADTDPRARGHLTFYPGDGESVALQVPFRESGSGSGSGSAAAAAPVVPGHRVVHEGACRGDE